VIPRDYITQWREQAPWGEDFQLEQDLVISRALVEIFSNPVLAEMLAFRGGTALYKLYLMPPARYSEDIDLVQIEPGPAGPMMDGLRNALDPWLGEARWKQSQARLTFGYRFQSEDVPSMRLRPTLEINTREHFALLGFKKHSFSVGSRWYSGQADWLQERFPKAELRDVEGLVKLVERGKIEAHDWSLTPGRYVGVTPEQQDEDFDFEEALRSIHIDLEELNEEAVVLAARIARNFEELGV